MTINTNGAGAMKSLVCIMVLWAASASAQVPYCTAPQPNSCIPLNTLPPTTTSTSTSSSTSSTVSTSSTSTSSSTTSTSSSSTTSTSLVSGSWAWAGGSSSSDVTNAVAIDTSGNVFAAGRYNGATNFGLTNAGAEDAFLVKFSPTGTLLWVKGFGGTAGDFFKGVAVDASGNVLVTGKFGASVDFGTGLFTAAGSGDIVLAKYSGSDGSVIWAKQFGSINDDDGSSVAVDSSGNVYITGYFRSTINFGGANLTPPFNTDLDVFVAKFSSAGMHQWSKNFTNTGNDRGYGIAVDTTGVTITGSFSNVINFGGSALSAANAMIDGFVARFDTVGTHVWSRQFGAPDGNESGFAVALDGGGNSLVTGYAIKDVDMGTGVLAALSGTDAVVAKYGTNGTPIWSRRMGGIINDYGYGIAVDSSNAVYLAVTSDSATVNTGGSNFTSRGYKDGYLVKLSSTNVYQWTKQLGGTQPDELLVVAVRSPVIAGGYFTNSGTFDGIALTANGASVDAFVLKTAQ